MFGCDSMGSRFEPTVRLPVVRGDFLIVKYHRLSRGRCYVKHSIEMRGIEATSASNCGEEPAFGMEPLTT